MNPKRAQRILDKAYATLERTADVPRPDLSRRVAQERIEAMEIRSQYMPPRRQKMQRSIGRDGLVYKVTDNGAAMPHQQEQETAQAWVDFMDTRVAEALNQFSKAYSDEIVELMFTRMAKIKSEADAEILALKQEIKELRVQMLKLREIAKGNVSELRYTVN
jgi:predicted ArsR family transcriptional regulator